MNHTLSPSRNFHESLEVNTRRCIPHLNVEMKGVDITDSQLKLLKAKYKIFSSPKSGNEFILDLSCATENDMILLDRIFDLDTSALKNCWVLLCL